LARDTTSFKFHFLALEFCAKMRHSSFVPIPPNELRGAIVSNSPYYNDNSDLLAVHKVVNIFAILSTLALVSVAIRAVWLLIRRHPFLTASEKREHTFLNTHIGQYGTCLLLAMTLSTTSGIIGISWLAQRGITEGLVAFLSFIFLS